MSRSALRVGGSLVAFAVLVVVGFRGCSSRPKPMQQMTDDQLLTYIQKTSSVPDLVEGLKHKKLSVREEAVKRLKEVQPKDGAVVAELVRLCVEDKTDLRPHLASLLETLGADALPALTEAFRKGSDDERRWMAASVLERIVKKIGQPPADTTDALKEGLRDKSGKIRRAAASVLEEMGPHAKEALSELVALVGRDLPAYRKGAFHLYSDQDWAEGAALRALSHLGSAAEKVVPTASELLTLRPEGLTALAALHLIEQLGQGGQVGWPAVAAALKSSDKQVREKALEALAEIGQKHPIVVLDLMRFLRGPTAQKLEPGVWTKAQHIVARIGPASLPALRAALKDEKPDLRLDALAALEILDSDGRAAWDSVLPLLDSRDANVKQAAMKVVSNWDVKEPPILDALVKLLDTADVDVKRAVLKVISVRPVKDPLIIRALVKAINDPEESVRADAVSGVGGLDPGSERASEMLDTLVKALSDPNESVRCNAASGIGNLGPRNVVRAPEMLDALMKAMKDPHLSVRCQAITEIGRFGPAAAKVVPRLVPLLADQKMCHEAAQSLRNIGPAAVPTLMDLIAKGNPPEAVWNAFDESGVGPLTELLAKKDPILRRNAALTLGRLRAPIAAAPLLEEWVAAKGDRRKFTELLQQLAAIEDRRRIEPQLPVTEDELVRVPTAAAKAIPRLLLLLKEEARVKLKSGEIVPIKSLPSLTWQERAFALDGGKEKESPLDEPQDVDRIEEEAAGVRCRAAQALGMLGPAATKEAEQALVEALRDNGEFRVWTRSGEERRFVKDVAARALLRIDPKARERFPALDALLSEREMQGDARKKEGEARKRIAAVEELLGKLQLLSKRKELDALLDKREREDVRKHKIAALDALLSELALLSKREREGALGRIAAPDTLLRELLAAEVSEFAAQQALVRGLAIDPDPFGVVSRRIAALNELLSELKKQQAETKPESRR